MSEVEVISQLEVLNEIKRLKVEKCSGSDGITNEAIKEGLAESGEWSVLPSACPGSICLPYSVRGSA